MNSLSVTKAESDFSISPGPWPSLFYNLDWTFATDSWPINLLHIYTEWKKKASQLSLCDIWNGSTSM